MRIYLNYLASQNRIRDAQVLSQAILSGDGDGLYALSDCLEDERSESMKSLKVGENYFIMTVTMYYCGRLIYADFAEIVLEEASWIPEVGRQSDAFRTGNFQEVEPFPDRITVSTGAVVAVIPWPHPLPRQTR